MSEGVWIALIGNGASCIGMSRTGGVEFELGNEAADGGIAVGSMSSSSSSDSDSMISSISSS